jgi:hypothetical protein
MKRGSTQNEDKPIQLSDPSFVAFCVNSRLEPDHYPQLLNFERSEVAKFMMVAANNSNLRTQVIDCSERASDQTCCSFATC